MERPASSGAVCGVVLCEQLGGRVEALWVLVALADIRVNAVFTMCIQHLRLFGIILSGDDRGNHGQTGFYHR